MQNNNFTTEIPNPVKQQAEIPNVLFNKYGITVVKHERPAPIGIEYEVRSGNLFFNTSERPNMTFYSLNKMLTDYASMKVESETDFTEFEIVECPELENQFK